MEKLLHLAQTVGEALRKGGHTVCAAESCTGGLVMSALTDIAGSSAYVLGGVVTYSNTAKMQLLGVQEKTLTQHGAVSEQTAQEMASGVRRVMGADYAISVTGIAGPSGGTPQKPVGLVYIGIATPTSTSTYRYQWAGERIANKQASTIAALELLLNALPH